MPFELVTSKVFGIAKARNHGASQAHGNFIVMVDDDVTLDPKVWQIVLNIKRGEFAMARACLASGRMVAIHVDDYWRIGGFDNKYCCVGEDHDFYFRALQAGMVFHPIPQTLIHHKPHRERYRNIHFAIGSIKNKTQNILTYWRLAPKYFIDDFLIRIKTVQPRTLLLRFIFFYYLLFRKICRGNRRCRMH